ncbi:cupin domain-containing protein [Geodermatophilus sp. URMC 64]
MPEPPTVTRGVTRTPLLTAATPDGLRVDRFAYPPGGHTHWHMHSGEQVLYGEDGQGWLAVAGRPRVPIGPGDVVAVPVGHRHWHGATPHGPWGHLAVTAGGGTTWLGEVTDEEYEEPADPEEET